MRPRPFALGIDLGSTRIRVAHRVWCGSSTELEGVATRDVPAGAIAPGGIEEPEYVSALVEDAVREIGVRERRCVVAVGFPESSLRIAAFPPMSAWERPRTAYYEVLGDLDFPIEEAVVRTRAVPGDPNRCAIGVVRSRAIRNRVACLKKAGLRVMAVDDEGCAFRRALPAYDGTLDVGHHRSTLYLRDTCDVFQAAAGGATVTAAIGHDLSIDEAAAEKRKRILGTAGAGEAVRNEMVARIAALIRSANLVYRIDRIAAVGNGARLPGLLKEIASSSGALVEMAVSHVLEGAALSPDVTRASAPDWTLAAALSS